MKIFDWPKFLHPNQSKLSKLILMTRILFVYDFCWYFSRTVTAFKRVNLFFERQQLVVRLKFTFYIRRIIANVIPCN